MRLSAAGYKSWRQGRAPLGSVSAGCLADVMWATSSYAAWRVESRLQDCWAAHTPTEHRGTSRPAAWLWHVLTECLLCESLCCGRMLTPYPA